MEFKKYKIKDIANVVTDYVANGSFKSLKENVNFSDNEDYAILIRLVDYNNNFKGPFKYVDMKGYEYLEKTKLFGEEIIISNVGANAGTVFKVPCFNKPMTLGPNSIMINLKGDNNYFYYYFKSIIGQSKLKSILSGSAQPKFNKTDFKNIDIEVPDLKSQVKIGGILKKIDKKIENNRNIIANLEELSQTLFKRWFIDFEFPDRNDAPYKSSGGEMIDSELGEIPKNWSIKTVKETAESFNSIRKPLSKLEREKRESIYPYYGATKIIDYVDNYIFDGKYILVGEDGTVQTEAGNPFIQYVWGKFWVSNHAHILKGKLISDELLMLYLKNTNVAPYITGAVQPKLNKKNLNSIKFVIADKETIIKFENFIKSYFQKIRILNKENKKLIELRDTLLPKFMSGELEIPDDIEVNSDELSI